MDYSAYKKSRDLTWALLSKYNMHSLPIDVLKIAKGEGVAVKSFNFKDKNQLFSQYKINENKKAFCINTNGLKIIFYDSSLPLPEARFNIAHELGHILLEHDINYHNESQANVFASRLLCPATLIYRYKLESPEDIANLCEVDLLSAQLRWKRMQILKARQKFYTSYLECKI